MSILFHSTDFPTLCAYDAEACATETGPPTGDAEPPDATDEPAAPIDFCTNSPSVARRLAERACGYLGACLGPREDSNFGACMIRALAAYDCSFNPSLRPRGESAVLWDCLSKIDSCDDVALCVFGTKAPACPSGNLDPTAFTACNKDGGSVVVECGPSTTALGMTPCALRGRTCARLDVSTSICTGKRGGSCTVSPRCDGTSAVRCKSAGGIDSDEGTDCAAYGDGRCASDDAGVACAPPASAGACALGKTSEVRCSDGGTFAESCVDSRAVRFNCAAIGLGCSAAGVSTTDPVSACKNLLRRLGLHRDRRYVQRRNAPELRAGSEVHPLVRERPRPRRLRKADSTGARAAASTERQQDDERREERIASQSFPPSAFSPRACEASLSYLSPNELALSSCAF